MVSWIFLINTHRLFYSTSKSQRKRQSLNTLIDVCFHAVISPTILNNTQEDQVAVVLENNSGGLDNKKHRLKLEKYELIHLCKYFIKQIQALVGYLDWNIRFLFDRHTYLLTLPHFAGDSRFWARPPAKNVPPARETKNSRFEILLPHYLPRP